MIKRQWFILFLCVCFMLQGCAKAPANSNIAIKPDTNTVAQIKIDASEEIAYPEYSGNTYAVIDNNVPDTTMGTTKNHYILNTNSFKIHIPECSSVKNIAEYNKKDYYGKMSELLSNGYNTRKQCDPEKKIKAHSKKGI